MCTVGHFNSFNASCSKLLLFEGFSAILVYNTAFFISDIRALWRSVWQSVKA